MAILSYSEIDNACISVIDNGNKYGFNYGDLFQNFYNIGCRLNELLDRSRWEFVSLTELTLQPQKGNNLRTIQSSQLTSLFYDYLLNGASYYSSINTTRLTYHYKKFIDIYPLFVGDKRVDINLFRHRFIKKLDIDGYSQAKIQTIMGYTNPATQYNYINSNISTITM
jgi:hypothetical protein